MEGKLTLVPTPIGNLEDITLRAIRVLSESDYILAEDTRTAGQLLRHLNIDKKLFAHHQHNEHHALAEIIKFLKKRLDTTQLYCNLEFSPALLHKTSMFSLLTKLTNNLGTRRAIRFFAKVF